MKTIKRIFSVWTWMALAAFAIALDFYLAIHGNEHPTGEQLFTGYSIIVFFTALGCVSIGAAIESFNKK